MMAKYTAAEGAATVGKKKGGGKLWEGVSPQRGKARIGGPLTASKAGGGGGHVTARPGKFCDVSPVLVLVAVNKGTPCSGCAKR